VVFSRLSLNPDDPPARSPGTEHNVHTIAELEGSDLRKTEHNFHLRTTSVEGKRSGAHNEQKELTLHEDALGMRVCAKDRKGL
jgi:hypothetical protein